MPATPLLNFPKPLLDQLFPYHLVLDQNFKVVDIGDCLARIQPELAVGDPMEKAFTLERPKIGLDFDEFSENLNMLFAFEEKSNRYRLRGQILLSEDDRRIIFLCSPWISDLDVLWRLGLGLNDFPLHDASVDVLQVLQSQKMMVEDLKNLNTRLTNQRAALRESNQQLLDRQEQMRRLSLVAAQTTSPVILADANDRVEWVNQAFTNLTGYSLEEVKGRIPSSFLCGPETDPKTLEIITESNLAGTPFSCEIVNYTKAGKAYWLDLEVHPIRDENGGNAGFMAIQHDLTARRLAARYAEVEYSITRLLAEQQDASYCLKALLALIGKKMGYCAGLFWSPTEDKTQLTCRHVWAQPSIEDSEFLVYSRVMGFAPGIGLPGSVWAEAKSRWMPDLSKETNFSRLGIASNSGVRSGFGFPILANGNFFGMIEFFDFEVREPDSTLLDMFSRIGLQIGQAMERSEAEAKRAELLSLLQAIFDATDNGIVVTNLKQEIVSQNQRMIDLWRVPPEFLNPNQIDSLREFIREQLVDPQSFIDRIRELQADPRQTSRDVVHFKDGRVLDRYSQAHIIGDHVFGRVWSYRDVTDQAKSEEALRESEARFRVVAETASDGILTIDERDQVLYANAAASRIFTYPKGSLIGMPLQDLIPVGISHSFCSLQSFEVLGLNKSGIYLPLEVSVGESTIAGENQLTVIFRDITERKRVESQLQEAKEQAEASNRSKSEFLANMSHELRTPLNAILGYSEIIAEDATDNGHTEYLSDLNRILTAGRHLLSLINDILDLSKIEAGKMIIQPEWINVETLVEECIATVKPLAAKNNNKIVVHPWSPLGSYWTDPTRFRQSLFNLLSNACKFTQNGQVELSMQPEMIEGKEWTHWCVRDNGKGISEEDQQKLFTAFTQVNSSSSKNEGGTGLGLAITRRLCDAMGGKIELKSALGEGSAFTITLPRLKLSELDDSML
ncbi:MAG: PAS domain S-box protein [Acidobacteria bacterium]|nr:PAS domain S-box protein [Acidobacteriota bacterium]